ncbi:hypothetical protein HDA31_001981 [Micromonospora carbonacea subsp. aurantiaca]|nr:hypothetical protein [Micromonospora carbonacea]
MINRACKFLPARFVTASYWNRLCCAKRSRKPPCMDYA